MSTIFLSLTDGELSCFPKVKQIVDNHPEIYKKEALYDTYPSIHHVNDAHIRYHNNKWYLQGRGMSSKYSPLKLKSIDVPDDTYIVSDHKSTLQRKISDDDTIVCLDNFFVQTNYLNDDTFKISPLAYEHVLSILKYLDDNGGNTSRVYIADSNFKTDSFSGDIKDCVIPLDSILQTVLENLKNHNFETIEPKSKKIATLRINANMTRTEFAKYLNIPYRTIENWEKDINKCPDYLFDLIEYKLDSEELFYREPGEVSKIKFNGDIDISVFGKLSKFVSDDNVNGLTIFPNNDVMVDINGEHQISDIEFTPDDTSKFIDDLISITRHSRDMYLDNNTGKLFMVFMYNGKRMHFTININDKEYNGTIISIFWL